MKERRYTIDQLLTNPSFIRWVEGDPGRREAKQWNQWVKKSEKNRKLAIRAQQRLFGFSFEEPGLPDVQHEWDKVRREVTKNKQEKPVSRQIYTGKKRDSLGIFLKAAAVLLIGTFVGLSAYLYPESEPKTEPVAVKTIQTDYGEKRSINLSDGSVIILAANSKIAYNENWLEKSVKRISLEGEAYFSIAPQEIKGQPKFVVETEDGSASVWGTRFAMDTYGDGTRVVLEEGEVRVLPDKAKSSAKNATSVKPGQMAQYNGLKNSVELKEVNPQVHTSWTTNKLFFDNTPLSVLAKRIERTYGVEVIVENQEILQRNLSGSVDFRSLEGLTSAVAELFEIQIHQSGETLVIKQ